MRLHLKLKIRFKESSGLTFRMRFRGQIGLLRKEPFFFLLSKQAPNLGEGGGELEGNFGMGVWPSFLKPTPII